MDGLLLEEDGLLLEKGELGNTEKYSIRLHKDDCIENRYWLHLPGNDIEFFSTMMQAKRFIEGYAKGRSTFIKKADRINL